MLFIRVYAAAICSLQAASASSKEPQQAVAYAPLRKRSLKNNVSYFMLKQTPPRNHGSVMGFIFDYAQSIAFYAQCAACSVRNENRY